MSNRNIVVDRLRALAMLGVIGIHIGPFVFASSTPRLDLFLLFQVFTRFAVPASFSFRDMGCSVMTRCISRFIISFL